MSRRDGHDGRADHLVNMLGPLDGARILGGCEHCDAYQTVEAVKPGVWVIHVFHDEWCPVLLKMEGKQ
jgi:hypothetical protein